jgi:hypothetical protein
MSAALAAGGCSESPKAPEAPTGAMEGFAEKHARDEAAGKTDRLEAARAREAGRAADARQKVQAAEGIDRFERTEKALEAHSVNNAGARAAEGFTSPGAATK